MQDLIFGSGLIILACTFIRANVKPSPRDVLVSKDNPLFWHPETQDD